jgi:predicted Zn-dependent peptidase
VPRLRTPAAARAGTTRTLTRGADGGAVRRTVLPGGLRVITEEMPGMHSASFGVWVGVGSRDETPALSGASHYLEHLLFKGTRRRSALDIAVAMDAVGGELNAFTAKEHTCYYAHVLDSDLPLAVDVVCDVVTQATIAPEDVENERGVILEEIAMHEDEPGEEVHDLFAQAVYDGHPLGRRISGTTETIGRMTRDRIHDFYRSRYTAPSIVVTAAGNLEHDRVVRLVTEAVSGTPLAGTAGDPALARAGGQPPAEQAATVAVPKDTEQAHLVLGAPTMGRTDDRRFALEVLNNVLGGGMSSRLFQEVREKRGLAYSVYSYTSQYADSGVFAVYAGCAPGKAEEVLELTRAELATVAANGITEAELARGKGMLKGSLVLGLEDTGSRMSRLAKSEMLFGDLLSVDDLLAKVNAVDAEQVGALAADLLVGPMSLAVIGPFNDGDFS